MKTQPLITASALAFVLGCGAALAQGAGGTLDNSSTIGGTTDPVGASGSMGVSGAVGSAGTPSATSGGGAVSGTGSSAATGGANAQGSATIAPGGAVTIAVPANAGWRGQWLYDSSGATLGYVDQLATVNGQEVAIVRINPTGKLRAIPVARLRAGATSNTLIGTDVTRDSLQSLPDFADQPPTVGGIDLNDRDRGQTTPGRPFGNDPGTNSNRRPGPNVNDDGATR